MRPSALDVTALETATVPVADPALPDGWPERLGRRCPWPRRALFTAALTARTAHDGAVAPSVVGWAVRAGHLAGADRLAAEIVLSEALANAVLHGCLEMPGQKECAGDLDAYFELLDTRMRDDRFGLRPVALTWSMVGQPVSGGGGASLLVLHVEDAGSGFTMPHGSTLEKAALSGRGHFIISALVRRQRVSRGGRRLSIGFHHA